MGTELNHLLFERPVPILLVCKVLRRELPMCPIGVLPGLFPTSYIYPDGQLAPEYGGGFLDWGAVQVSLRTQGALLVV